MIHGLQPRLAAAWKIKIGRKGAARQKKDGSGTYQMPERLDHFVVTTTDRGADNNLIPDPEAERLFGKSPKRIKVTLLWDDPERNLATSYAAFSGRKLFCRGDGRTAARNLPGGPVEVPCPCERLRPDYAGREPCKINGVLSVLLDGMPAVGAVAEFRTTSHNSVVQLMSSLALIARVTGGVISGIPLDLVLTPRTVTRPDGTATVVYVVHLEFAGTLRELRDLGLSQIRDNAHHKIEVATLERSVAAALLPAPAAAVFDGETEAEVSEEFYPIDDAPAGPPIDDAPAVPEQPARTQLQQLEDRISQQPQPEPDAAAGAPRREQFDLIDTDGVVIGQYPKTLRGGTAFVDELSRLISAGERPELAAANVKVLARLGESKDKTLSDAAVRLLGMYFTSPIPQGDAR